MRRPIRILMLEDSAADAELVERELRRSGIEFESSWVNNREAFLQALESFSPDLVLADYSLPAFNGMHALEIARSRAPEVPFILVSGSVGEETAIDIMRSGATDYVLKHRMARFVPAVRRAVAEAEERSQRRAAEVALACRAAELERSNADLEQFAYVCSNDLREPLRTIAYFTDLIRELYHDKLDDRCRDYFKHVVEGAEHMRQMIDGIFEYSRVTSEAPKPTACESTRALRTALERLAPLVQRTGAVVTDADLPTVLAREDELARVFQNLVANGVKFNRSTPPVVHVRAEREGRQWVFSVSDNGIGIPAHARERVFEMFHRLHGRAEYPGEGVGLAICKKIVERYGGRIWIDANPDGGSVVRFTAPVVVAAAAAAA